MFPETPVLISGLVGMIGVLGLMAGLVARESIRREENILERGSVRFTEMAQTGFGADSSPTAWLSSEGLQADSHFGDRLISVWRGWRAHRIPSLMELHSLSSGRERRRLWARLAGGITGLLVVSGIAGTLICIHPILDGFNISGDASGVVDSSKRAGSAMAMIQSLGRAFWPSLTALLFTFIVASGRGYYSHAASKLAWELDRFSLDILFASFRSPTFGEQLVELQTKLSRLVDRMEHRDEGFGTILDSLNTTISGFKSSEASLQTAADGFAKAAASIAIEAASVRSGFETHLGAESPVITGLASIVSAAQANQQTAHELHEAGMVLGVASKAITERVEQAGNQLEMALSTIPSKIEHGCVVGSEAIVATSRAAAIEAAAAVTSAGSHAAGKLHQAVAAAPQAIIAGTAQAGQTVVEACRVAADEAAEIFAQAAAAGCASLQMQIEPIRVVAEEISGANTTLQTDVRHTLSVSLNDFEESSTAVLNDFQDTIGKTAKQLSSSQQAASAAVEIADRLIERVDRLRNTPSWPKRLWQKIMRPLRKNQ